MYLSFVNSTRVIILFVVMPLVINAVSPRWKDRETNVPPTAPNAEEAKHLGAGMLDIVYVLSSDKTPLYWL